MAENLLGISVKKEENFSEWYSEIIQKAELADIRFGVQGFVVHRPWGFFIIKKIYEYLEKEVEEQGHQAFLFPSVVKEENLTKEKEHAGFTPEVFWVSEAGDKKIEERFALRPTGEAQIYPLYALWFRTYRDLPFLGYQSRISVFRNEMTTRPFLRGREFLFFETHDVFDKHEEALNQIKKDLGTCSKVINEKIKIPFFYFKRPSWDKFKGADNTFTPDTVMPDGKRNQLASTHDLGQNFSKAFGIKIKDEEGGEHHVWQTCFGPGIWRIMAALIGIHGDDKGLNLPFDMAPIQVIIIPIYLSKEEKLTKKIDAVCDEIERSLKKRGYRTRIDNSKETPGAKYNHWELLGVPLRIEIGPKEAVEDMVSIVGRIDRSKKKVTRKEMEKVIAEFVENNDHVLAERAKNYLQGRVQETSKLQDLVKIMKDHRGFVKVPFCSVDKDGEPCEEQLKLKTEGAKVCGTLYPNPEKVPAKAKCIICNKEAKHVVYTAKSY